MVSSASVGRVGGVGADVGGVGAHVGGVGADVGGVGVVGVIWLLLLVYDTEYFR